jgi:DNA-directed RNA polymerase specialized sigma24 family protein
MFGDFLAARSGHAASLVMFLRAVGTPVVRFIASRLGRTVEDAEVEDVTAEVLSKVALNLPSCRATTPSAVWKWVWRITQNTVADAQRRAAKSTDREVPIDPGLWDGQADRTPIPNGMRLLLELLRDIAETLPENVYTVLYLKEVEHESWKAIGQELGITWKQAEYLYRKHREPVLRDILRRIRSAPAADRREILDFLRSWRTP